MDLTAEKIQKILTHRRVGLNGNVTIERKLQPIRKRKVVLAQGKGEHTIGNVVLSQLIPFRGHMLSQLRTRGYNVGAMPWRTVVVTYYNEFVSNKLNSASPFTPINTYEFCNNTAFKVSPKDSLTGDMRDFRNAEGMGQLGNVVDNIVNTYKFALGKKQRAIVAGEDPKYSLSDVELSQARAAERVQRRLENKLKDNYAVRQGTVRKLVIWALVIWVAYILLK